MKHQKNTQPKAYKKPSQPAPTETWNTKMREAFMAAMKPLEQGERK